jgi:hypothetical protein
MSARSAGTWIPRSSGGETRIALGQNAIRPALPEILVEAANELAGEDRRRVTIASMPDGEVRAEVEFGKGAVEQIALLAGRYDPDGRPFGLAQAADDGGHLDDFRPGSNHEDKSADRRRLAEMISARVMHTLLSKKTHRPHDTKPKFPSLRPCLDNTTRIGGNLARRSKSDN